MKTVAWRAFHTGGETVAKHDLLTAFGKLPDEKIMLSLVLYHDRITPGGVPYRTLVDGKDHYVAWDGPDGLVFFCSNDPIDDLKAKYPGCVVKLGIEIPIDEFKAIDAQAMAARTI